MGYVKNISIALIILILIGCTTTKQKQTIYEEGYREGVSENIEQIVEEKEKDPLLSYDWIEPIIQEVTIPSHIANGVFVPEHKELVIINPGQWRLQPGFPIQGGQSHAKKETVLQFFNTNVSDITVLPDNYRAGTGDSSRTDETTDYSTGMGKED